MKKRRTFLMVFAALLLIISCIARIIYINCLYPPAKSIIYSLNEAISYNNIELTVTSADILADDVMLNLFKDEVQRHGDALGIVAEITLHNKSMFEQETNLSGFIFESGGWKNAINLLAFMELNSDNPIASLHPILEPGESINLKLPVLAVPVNTRKSQWENFSQRKFYLTVALYPEKKMIAILND